MKKIIVLLISGLVVAASDLCAEDLNPVGQFSKLTEITSEACVSDVDLKRTGIQLITSKNTDESTMLAYGYATIPAGEMLTFQPCGQVDLTNLIVALKVTLNKGCLRVHKGVYRISYASQLQNLGQADFIQLWLTTQTVPFGVEKVIPESRIQGSLNPFTIEKGPTTTQVAGEVLVQVDKTSLICLHYSTKGRSILTSIPPSSLVLRTPVPFYLLAIKIADINSK